MKYILAEKIKEYDPSYTIYLDEDMTIQEWYVKPYEHCPLEEIRASSTCYSTETCSKSNDATHMLPSDYRRFSEKAMRKDLRRQDNLQDSASTVVLNKMRGETLASLDYDQDDVYDVVKMKISADSKRSLNDENDTYIRSRDAVLW